MPSDYREIGNEILNELEIDPTRLGEALSTLNEVVRDRLERDAWNEVFRHCGSAYKLCNEMHGSEELKELSNAMDLAHAEGIFHAYKGVSHLYQTEEAREKGNVSAESEGLARATDCLEKSWKSFRGEYRDQWNESIICLSLGRLYRDQNKLNEALLAFQRSCIFSSFNKLSIERMQEIEKVASIEMEKTRRLFGDQKPFASGELKELPPPPQHRVIPFKLPIISEIAAGKERPVSDDIIGYIQQTDEFEFEFEGQALKVEPLRGSQLAFLPEYNYAVAVPILGDSMDQAGISPNDYVILQKPKGVPLKPSSGDIVAVVFHDEDNKATLKRFYFDKSSGSVTLEPESSNPEHKTRVLQPEVFAGDNPSVEVVGTAIAVLKPPMPIVDQVETRKERPLPKERLSQEIQERLLREAKDLLQETKKLLEETKELPQETREALLQETKELLQGIKRLPKETEERLLQEAKDLLQETKDLLQESKGPPQEAIEGSQDIWAEFVKKAGAVAIWDRESQKVISPLKEKLSMASELIIKESKREEWEPLRKAISEFCQYTFATQVSKTLVKELRQLVAELVSNIIANLSPDKHPASVEQYLKDLIKQLQRL